MPSLVLKRFQCVEDTDESGGESPYFLTWVGDIRRSESALRLTRKAYWNNNVDKGAGAWPVDDTVTAALTLVPADTLALAIMVEKDEGIDIVSSEVDSMRSILASALEVHRQAGFSASDANFISTLRNTFTAQVRARLHSSDGADDDLMEEDHWRAARRIVLTGQNEELALVTFKGGTGEYRVRYVQTA